MNCDTYWGSHGCDLPRGHPGWCVCWSCYDPADTVGYVGAFPYYGADTNFYGEGAERMTAGFRAAVGIAASPRTITDLAPEAPGVPI